MESSLPPSLRYFAHVFLYIILTFFGSYSANAQLSFNFGPPPSISACGDEEYFSFTFINQSAGSINVSQVQLNLAAGLVYVPGSLEMLIAPAGFSMNESSFSMGNVSFTANGQLGANQGVEFRIRAKALCNAISNTSIFNTIAVTMTIPPSTTAVVQTKNSPNFNVQHAVLNIGSIVPSSFSFLPGVPYTRTLTLVNGGFGYTRNALLTLNSSCVSIVSTNRGTLSGNQVSFSAADMTAFGDSDNRWELGESNVVTLTLVASDCNCSIEPYTISWGCESTVCQSSTSSASLTPIPDQPQIQVTLTRGEYPSSCADSETVTITFTNTATETVPGGAAAFNLDFRFGWDRGGNPRLNPERHARLIIENFHIEGTPFTPNTGTLDFGYQTPAGVLNVPHGGLQDLDGDGIYNDLPAGASVSFTMTVRYECESDCGVDLGTKILTGWVSAESQLCNTTSLIFANDNAVNGATIASANHFILINTRGTSENVFPDNLYEGVPASFTICMDREIRNFNCPTDELVLMIEKVPGYTILPSDASVTVDDTSDPDWFLVSPNPALGYTNPPSAQTNTRFDDFCLTFNIILDCSAPGFDPQTFINYRFRYTCDNSCNCAEFHDCGQIGDDVLPAKICTPPSGPGGCGIFTNLFGLSRTTLGWTDYTQTTLITPNPSVHKLNRAMSCDVVHFNARGIVIDDGWANMQFEIRHNWNFHVFDYVGAQLIVKRGATQYTCPLPAPTFSGSAPYRISFDFAPLVGACLPAGFTFALGDTLEINGDFSVVKSPLLPELPSNIIFSAGFIGIRNNDAVSCPFVNRTFQLHRPSLPQFYPSLASIKNCHTGYIDIAALITSPSSAHYPSEFRPVSVPVSLTVTLPSGFEFADAPAYPHLFQIVSPNILYTIPNTAYTISGNTVTYHSASFPKTDSTWMRFIVPIRMEECASSGMITGDWTFRDYDYAQTSCHEERIVPYQQSLVASMDILTLSGIAPVIEAYTNYETFTFTLQSPLAVPATNFDWSWFSINSPHLIIDKIEDITAAPFVDVPVIALGGGLYQAQVGTLGNNQTRNYRVHYRWTSCNDFTVQMQTGWSCSGGYPALPAENNCTLSTTEFVIAPQNVVLQGSLNALSSSVGICDTLLYELTLNNAAKGYVRNLVININYPPAGMTFVSGSGEMQYPVADSAPFVAIPDPAGNTTWQLNALESKFALGLPGVTVLDSNKVKIRFKIKLDCDLFVGESQLGFFAIGQSMCGGVFGTPIIFAPPPSVSGAEPPYALSTSCEVSNLPECGQKRRLRVTASNQGFGTTTNQDYIAVDLPNGFSYGGGYLSESNALTTPDLTIIPLTTGTRLKFRLPHGVAPSQSVIFSFDVLSVPNLPCGNYPARTLGIAERALFCSTTQDSCQNVMIKTGESSFILQVIKPTISLDITNIDFRPTANHGWFQMALYGNVNNNSNTSTHEAGSMSLTIDFYCDKGTTVGSWDAGDNWVASYTTTVSIPSGGAIPLFDILLPQTFTLADCNITNGLVWKIEQERDLGTPDQQCLCAAESGYLPQGLLLPLAWLDVSAEARETGNLIAWKVIESAATEFYTVEKMLAEDQWAVIGKLDALKNRAGETITYTFEDLHPKSLEYYRVKSAYNDGTVSYSQMVKVMRDGETEGFWLYPNPAQNEIFLVASEDATVKLADVLGREIMTTKIMAHVRNPINIQALSEGMYFFHLYTPSGARLLKWVKKN